jgi:hypothetical protein
MIRLVSRMAFWVGLLVVVALSLVPQDSVPSTSWGDKADHAAAYAFLA